jgi:asparagine synthetase B (glutamine-hydrolysing)
MAEFTFIWGEPSWTRACCDRLGLGLSTYEGPAGKIASAVWFDHNRVPEPGDYHASDEHVVAWVGQPAAAAWLIDAVARVPGSGAVDAGYETAITSIPGALTGCLWHRPSGVVVAFRDRLGNVPLHLRYQDGAGGAVSTLAPHAWRANEGALVVNVAQIRRFLTIHPDHGNEDFFGGVERLRPGELVRFQTGRAGVRRRYWSPVARRDLALDPVEQFREALDDSVARSLTAEPTIVCMSGGLDSTAIAASLARHLHATRDHPLDVASMVFPKTAACDESEQLDELERALPLRVHRFGLDEDWPLRDLSSYSRNTSAGPCFHPGTEYELTFRHRIKEQLGSVDLLVGHGGDQMLSVSRLRFLRALWKGRRRAALVRVLWRSPATANRLALIEGLGRDAGLARILDKLRAIRHRRAKPRSPWVLTPEGEPDEPGPDPLRDWRFDNLLSWEWEHASRTLRQAARISQLRSTSPMADFRLWELALDLPADILAMGERNKGLLRAATKGRLPDNIRLRMKLKTFDKQVEKGLGDLGASKVRRLFRRPRLAEMGLVDTPTFLRAYEEYCGRVRAAGTSGSAVGSLPIWRTVATELWLRVVA